MEEPIRTVIALAIVLASLLAARPVCARTVGGVEMPDSIQIGQTLLRLNGMALYRKFGFPILVSSLYWRHQESDPKVILGSDSPRKYVAHFLHRVSAKRISDAWKRGLVENTPDASEEVRADFLTLYGWLRDFHSGDEIVVTYLPASGCRVEINGTEMGVIPGKEFADAYFALALGPRPTFGTKFQRKLLGK
jgi:hypothetical protein